MVTAQWTEDCRKYMDTQGGRVVLQRDPSSASGKKTEPRNLRTTAVRDG